MFKNIVKRDGRLARFDAAKIRSAILKAGEASGEFGPNEAEDLSAKVTAIAATLGESPSVEQLQDIVEEVLLSSPYRRTARAYIIYREQHARIREVRTGIGLELIDGYLDQLDWKISENSNMSFSLQGLNNYIASEVSQVYWLNKIYPKEVREAHLSGDFHIHDLNLLSVYCVGWDLHDLLRQGFRGAAGKVESRPARHFRTALGQIVNFFYTLQGEAAGAQAFSSLDTLLAPFIRYDGLDYDQVRQALQEFVFNINVPTRVGFQTPFTNVTLDLKVPVAYRDLPVLIGGREMAETYAEFQPEMDLFNRAFMEVMSAGDASGRVFTFPIPTYNITPDFDWNDQLYEGLWRMAGRYGIPYFANFINSEMRPEDARSMCCRLRLDERQLRKRGGGFFGANPLTGALGVVTLNLPRLGYLADDKAGFFKRLDKLMELAVECLEIKRKVLERYTANNLYPYTRHYLQPVKAALGEYWKNHFSTIGVVGMNEACLNLLQCDIASQAGQDFALEVLDHLNARLVAIQERSGNFYNLEATPAESTSYSLARLDKQRYADIICANEGSPGAEPFYTNSSQLPVNYTDDLFEALALQDELQTRYSGGTVLHIFMGEEMADPMAVRDLVRKVCYNYRLPYFTLTPTFSVCENHGYLRGQQERCAICGQEAEVYSRVVGYLRPVSQWNGGKQAEFALRKTFRV